MATLRTLRWSAVALSVVVLIAAAPARAHLGGTHTGFVSTVSFIEPQLPGLLVQVLGGHERLSVANLTRRNVVIFDAGGDARVTIPAGETRVWAEPRIGAAEPPPEREGLVRYWRIPGAADRERFEIVGFLGYRPPPGAQTDDNRVPTWAIALAAVTGALALAAAVAVGLRRRREP